MNNDQGIIDLAAGSRRPGFEPPQDQSRTSDSVALMFSTLHENNLRYVAKWGKWLMWTGSVWQEDDTIAAWDLIRAFCRAQKEKAASKPSFVSDVERFVKADRRQAAVIDQWDTDPWALNTPAGIVDLETGRIGPHKHDSYMTKITAVAPEGGCKRWLQFLDEITAGDAELVAFLQRLAGYGLTGSTQEHAFAFLYGTGANGKGTFLNAIMGVLGDYAAVSPMETFTESFGERHPTELAMLRGARLVVAQETDEGKRWAESRIKTLTGGDPITAHFMRQDNFTFTPQFKLLIAGNHKPQLRNVDEAMRRRLHLVPFTVTIPAKDRDKTLAETLRAEWPGILAWMVEGCAAYCRDGLAPCAAVREATEAYFQTQDAFGTWIETCCEVGPDYKEMPKRLFNSWRSYAEEMNEPTGGSKSFGDRLEQVGHPRRKVNGTRWHEGLRFTADEAQKW